MIKVTFKTPADETIVVNASSGTLMEAARNNSVDGIDADCGGSCACATCHVKIDAAWRDKLPAANDMELTMLEFEEDVDENSRLSCQVTLSDELDGLIAQVVGR